MKSHSGRRLDIVTETVIDRN
ncbi:hypothetical protein DSM3645_00915 [Blastopirellula marina DSM 3645]|uniref:Uncharacterized protein n=1 Tax=Blastopirellula marina DSM 3645 TaxID=314230 RepID=A3ZMQ5_9BACT|nr:hypothetical protein DSM3645_00915 [Blastopirellula marina DSM 3645]